MLRDKNYYLREISHTERELAGLLATLNGYIKEYNHIKNSKKGVDKIFLKKWYESNVVPVHVLIKKKNQRIKTLKKRLRQ